MDKLGCQLSEVHLINLDFLLFNQIKKQIERPFKDFKFNFVIRHVNRGKTQTRRRNYAVGCLLATVLVLAEDHFMFSSPLTPPEGSFRVPFPMRGRSSIG